jgi:hypothetical protein
VCHNDVCRRTSSRDGIAVALLDFEFAAPGRPVYDVAQLARLCTVGATSTRPGSAGSPTGRHGYDSSPTPRTERDGREELLTAMNDAIARIRPPFAQRRQVIELIAMWKRTGGGGATTAGAAGGWTTTPVRRCPL